MKPLLVLIICIIFSSALYTQTEWQRWGKMQDPYRIKTDHLHNDSSGSSGNGSILNLTKSLYRFLISDLDGDNCPFNPTCSSFFVEAVEETNIIKGTFMFADRFTRDLNILKIENQYPISNGKFSDPVLLYSNDSTAVRTTLIRLND